MCEKCRKPYYITTAIAYTSGKPHIGNTYEIVLADSIARYKREQGYDVRFQTGTDEHGQKIELKAAEAGVTPKEFVDQVAGEIRRIWDLMDTSYDKFIRTTDPDHERQVQKIFKKLYEKGDIYKGHYEGLYCTPCESFWTPSQVVDGKCPDCGRPVQPAREEAYFFRMSKYADRLIEHINAHPEFIQPVSRKNEMMNNFLLPGLQDLCVSRTSFKWGIPVDFDPGHVVYVWLDALTNYITGLGYDADGENGELFGRYWPADLHLIGKDIIRFHTIYWPIFLMALDLPLPKQVFGHPWLLQGDGKMSKSKGNVLYADTLVDFFGVDAVRYFVLHEMPFENDGVITWELMIERLNSDLANILGNLVKRTISMTNQYFGGVVENKGVSEPVDEDLKATVLAAVKQVDEKMEKLRVADAITEIFSIFRRSNKYIDETAPWVLAKDEASRDRLATVLYNLAESIAIGASLLCLLYAFDVGEDPGAAECAEAGAGGDGRVRALSAGQPRDRGAGDAVCAPEAGRGAQEGGSAGRRAGKGSEKADGRCKRGPAGGRRGGWHRRGGQAGDYLRGFCEAPVPGRRDHRLRGGAQVEEAALLEGADRKPGAPDRERHQGQLFAGGDGRQEGYGRDELKAREAGRNRVRGNASVRGGQRRKALADDAGERDALRRGDLLTGGGSALSRERGSAQSVE